MICSPPAAANRVSPAVQESRESPGTRSATHRAFVHAVPPSDPLRQAGRLPIKVLKMLTARSGHILHPEYLQPLPSTPVSPIELDAKKSPLALLAQTCSQIGKPDPTPSKLSSVSGSSAAADKEKSGPLKLSDIGAEDKSSFKPYSKHPDKKEPSSGDKSGFRVPSAACPPFTPRTGSPSSPRTPPPSAEPKASGGGEDKKEPEPCAKSGQSEGGRHGRLSAELTPNHSEGCKSLSAAPSPTPVSSSSSSGSVLGSGLVAPVSPYKPGHTVFPLPPAGMSYPGALSGAYAGYPPQFLAHGVSLDPTKGSSLVGAQLSSLGCSSKSAASSPLTGASPPSVMTASLCRDPYCLSYHCTSQLGASATCSHDLKSGYPLVYPSHALHGVSPPSLPGHPLYPYGFMLPNDPLPHVCNWVSATGPCDKRFSSSEELLGHLRTHTAFPGAADKLLPGYPSSSSLAAAAMACHMHMPPAGASPSHLTLRSPHHHPLGLSSTRYHPYSKSPLPSGGAPVPMPAATGHYYSPYALYGQRLTTASALGYQ
ncbi:hypothetical protein GDO78_008417 [Eleutherodactylus coqui]|uniref:C2H2-type domain-containing protein n=1 Tax=Eleutherodactylus coqui TaxID=57060 RepID=A0A8J6FE19_ELECQ|nr:hypothetical protein GDO78_008417 [Eleutherodactylus coqui]